MKKPTKWHVRLAKTQAGQSRVAKDPSFLQEDSKDSNQTGPILRLIWVFAGRTCHFVGFVMRWLISNLWKHMSHNIRKQTFGCVRPAKLQINLHIHAFWSESSLAAFLIDRMQSVFMRTTKNLIKLHLCRLIWVFVGHTYQNITKTCLYNCDPLKPHFCIVKLGFTGVYINFLISAQKHRLWVLVRTTSTHNLCFEQNYVKYQNFFIWKFSFLVVKFPVYLNRYVFGMDMFSHIVARIMLNMRKRPLLHMCGQQGSRPVCPSAQSDHQGLHSSLTDVSGYCGLQNVSAEMV